MKSVIFPTIINSKEDHDIHFHKTLEASSFKYVKQYFTQSIVCDKILALVILYMFMTKYSLYIQIFHTNLFKSI